MCFVGARDALVSAPKARSLLRFDFRNGGCLNFLSSFFLYVDLAVCLGHAVIHCL